VILRSEFLKKVASITREVNEPGAVSEPVEMDSVDAMAEAAVRER
jgi:hypothetical protein